MKKIRLTEIVPALMHFVQFDGFENNNKKSCSMRVGQQLYAWSVRC